MKATVILAHPYKGSLNNALYERVCTVLEERNVKTFAHDLYEENFDPLITVEELGKIPTTDPQVKQYTKEFMASDILVFIHPNWWGQPPAILKGYIDRVIRSPHAYDFPEGDSGGGLPIGKLKGVYGVVLNTSNTEKEREENFFQDPLQPLWEKCVFGFCGIEHSTRKMFRIVADSTLEERTQWLNETEEIITSVVEKQRALLAASTR